MICFIEPKELFLALAAVLAVVGTVHLRARTVSEERTLWLLQRRRPLPGDYGAIFLLIYLLHG